MPTWPGACMDPSVPGTNTRSPGRSWPRSATGVPAWNCSAEFRGRLTPAALYACWTREEQSHWWAGSPPWELVQSPSRWYGVPSWARAHMIAAVTAGGVSGGRLNPEGGATISVGSHAAASAAGSEIPASVDVGSANLRAILSVDPCPFRAIRALPGPEILSNLGAEASLDESSLDVTFLGLRRSAGALLKIGGQLLRHCSRSSGIARQFPEPTVDTIRMASGSHCA